MRRPYDSTRMDTRTGTFAAISAKIAEIWCVFDRDNHSNFEQTIQEAHDSGVQIALSNPHSDVWRLVEVLQAEE